MYGLNDDVDLGFLMNKAIIQICLGKYQIILRLGDSTSISVEGKMKYTMHTSPVKDIEINCSEEHAGILQRLFDVPIVRTEVKPPGDLLLWFGNNDQLVIYDSKPSFESYQISGGSGTIVV
jgi:hypothetical protein